MMSPQQTRALYLVLALVAAALFVVFAVEQSSARTSSSCDRACVERVVKRTARAEWRATVRPYRAVLDANVDCESRSSGGYGLRTTGNGYWFAHQFDRDAWTGAGGRVVTRDGDPHEGEPRGRWTLQPGPLEQDYRAIRWSRIHGGDAWPNCPLGPVSKDKYGRERPGGVG